MIKYLKSRTIAFTLISFLISLVLAGIIIAAAGYSPVEAYSAMLGGAFGSTYNLAQTAGTAIPLIFAGLAMAVASKAGIFNIGIEGQILAGALPAHAHAQFQVIVKVQVGDVVHFQRMRAGARRAQERLGRGREERGQR